MKGSGEGASVVCATQAHFRACRALAALSDTISVGEIRLFWVFGSQGLQGTPWATVVGQKAVHIIACQVQPVNLQANSGRFTWSILANCEANCSFCIFGLVRKNLGCQHPLHFSAYSRTLADSCRIRKTTSQILCCCCCSTFLVWPLLVSVNTVWHVSSHAIGTGV